MSSPREFDAPVIGLAGGIGSGKSTVAALLRDLGCVVTNSDEQVRAALDEDEVRDELVRWWGRDILNDEGRIDRARVARIVFEDEAQRRRLEGLLHPLVEGRRIEEWRREAARREVPAFVIDAPLLFEAGLDKQCDAVIFVDAPREIRLERVRRTRGWDEAELDRREKNQIPVDSKRQGSDYSVTNDGDAAELARRVRSVFNEILSTHHRRRMPPSAPDAAGA